MIRDRLYDQSHAARVSNTNRRARRVVRELQRRIRAASAEFIGVRDQLRLPQLAANAHEAGDGQLANLANQARRAGVGSAVPVERGFEPGIHDGVFDQPAEHNQAGQRPVNPLKMDQESQQRAQQEQAGNLQQPVVEAGAHARKMMFVGKYASILEVICLVDCLNISIDLIYPSEHNLFTKKELFSGRISPTTDSTLKSITLSWTSTSDTNVQSGRWMPNHFVPCGQLKVSEVILKQEGYLDF